MKKFLISGFLNLLIIIIFFYLHNKRIYVIDNIIKFIIMVCIIFLLEYIKNKFIDKYLDLSLFNVSQLKDIQNKAAQDQEFLSCENKILLKDLNKRIENELSKYKIENILSIFEELNSEDKKLCIDKLNNIIK